MLIGGSMQLAHVQTCFPQQLLGSFVACQSKMHGDACQSKKRGILVEVKTKVKLSSVSSNKFERTRHSEKTNTHPETNKIQFENISGPRFAK